MKLTRLINDKIAVRVILQEKTDSGIYYGRINRHVDPARDSQPEIQNEFLKGEVVAVGPGKRNKKGERIPLNTKVGDIIHFHQNFGLPIELDETLLIMSDGCVAGVWE